MICWSSTTVADEIKVVVLRSFVRWNWEEVVVLRVSVSWDGVSRTLLVHGLRLKGESAAAVTPWKVHSLSRFAFTTHFLFAFHDHSFDRHCSPCSLLSVTVPSSGGILNCFTVEGGIGFSLQCTVQSQVGRLQSVPESFLFASIDCG